VNETRYTVLIVDDDVEIVDLLKDHFKKRNCESIATIDPLLVIDKLQSFSIKLMLLDLKMRKLSGFDVLDKIKKAGIPLPPTIIITGQLSQYQDQLVAHGISSEDVIVKPFDFEVMEQRINIKLGSQIVASEVGSEYENAIYQKNRCKIGIIEDEVDVAEHLSEFFEERNYEVICCKNGIEGLERFAMEHVDILFVDIKLPGISGDHIIEKLSVGPNYPYMIPISADPLSPEIEAKLKAVGCEEFISKPFDVVELIEKVKTIAVQKKLLG